MEMQEEMLNELIKGSLKKACVKIDFSQNIMKKIDNYESKKNKIKTIWRFLLVFFTLFTSVLSIILIELFFKYHRSYLLIYNINTNLIKYALQFFYVFVIVSIVTIVLRFKKLKLFKLQSTL